MSSMDRSTAAKITPSTTTAANISSTPLTMAGSLFNYFLFQMVKNSRVSQGAIARPYLPSAFMYSSKLWLSTNFQVAQKASTMAAGYVFQARYRG